MKKLFIIVALMTGLNSNSQTYTFTPGKTFSFSADTMTYNYTDNGIEIVNTGSTTLSFTWKQHYANVNDCGLDLCNSGICLVGLPHSGVMPPIAPGEKGWIKFHVNPNKTFGISTVSYIVMNGVNPNDTLIYTFIVAKPTGIKEIGNLRTNVSIYPNPASDILVVDSKIENCTIQLFDVNGAKVLSRNINGGLNKIEVKEIAAGNYFYKISGCKIPISGKVIIAH